MKFPLVIALAAISLSCSQKEQDSAWSENEKTLIALSDRLRAKIIQEDTNSSKVSAAPSPIESEIKRLNAQKNHLQEEISQLSEGWDDFKRDILFQKRATITGIVFDELDPGNGRVYKEVRVTTIDDGGVAIRHSEGTARLRFDDLTPESHAYFGLDEEFSKNAIQNEQEQRIAYEKWIVKGMAAHKAARLTAAEISKSEDAQQEAQRLAASKASPAANTTPLSGSIGKLGETKTFSRRTDYNDYQNGRGGITRSKDP